MIALWNEGYEVREMAVMLGSEAKKIRRFLDRLHRCKHFVVRSCFLKGVPVDAAAPLPNDARIRCTEGHETKFIPCVQCAAKCKRENRCKAESSPKLKPCQPTQALPGTKAKVQVFKTRLKKGQSLYHAEDAMMLPDDVSPIWDPSQIWPR